MTERKAKTNQVQEAKLLAWTSSAIINSTSIYCITCAAITNTDAVPILMGNLVREEDDKQANREITANYDHFYQGNQQGEVT